jgi:hypothetical protein
MKTLNLRLVKTFLWLGFGRLPMISRLVLKVIAGSVSRHGLTWRNKYFAKDIFGWPRCKTKDRFLIH